VSDWLGARLQAAKGAGRGDAGGLGLVATLLERAGRLSPRAKERVLARAEALLDTYEARLPVPMPEPHPQQDPAWRETLEARARARPPRLEPPPIVSEIRAQKAVHRAITKVPEVAGPYHGTTVAARAMRELAALSPGYAAGYVAWLEDLGCLLDFPDRRPSRRKR
jgi:hypothetical protein